MNIKKIHIIILIAVIFMLSCKPSKIYENYYEFKNNSWNRFEKLYFKLPIENTKHNYNIFLSVKYTKQYTYQYIYIYLTIKTPSGEERMKEYKFKLRNKKGVIKAKKIDKIWNIRFLLKTGFHFSRKGICKFEIENLIPKLETPGIKEIGLIVERSN